MKNYLIFFVSLLFFSCSELQENDLELLNPSSSIIGLDPSTCDCGIGDLGGGGTQTGGSNLNNHLFSNYDYFGNISVKNYTNLQYKIYNKSILSFSYGLNLNNGLITDVALGNLKTSDNKVILIDYNYDSDFYIFHLRVEGKKDHHIWKLNKETNRYEYIIEEVPAYVNIRVVIETKDLPLYSNGGVGGEGIFPFSE